MCKEMSDALQLGLYRGIRLLERVVVEIDVDEVVHDDDGSHASHASSAPRTVRLRVVSVCVDLGRVDEAAADGTCGPVVVRGLHPRHDAFALRTIGAASRAHRLFPQRLAKRSQTFDGQSIASHVDASKHVRSRERAKQGDRVVVREIAIAAETIVREIAAIARGGERRTRRTST